MSPVKKTLSCDWLEASDRTKADYVKKARSIFHEVLKVIAPDQEDNIANIILSGTSQDCNTDFLDIISSAYKMTNDWGTQRQLLSLIAPTFTF